MWFQDPPLPPDAARRDDGIGKRTRLESEGGKTHARSERALSAMRYNIKR